LENKRTDKYWKREQVRTAYD